MAHYILLRTSTTSQFCAAFAPDGIRRKILIRLLEAKVHKLVPLAFVPLTPTDHLKWLQLCRQYLHWRAQWE